MEECSSIMSHPNEVFSHSISLYKPVPFTFSLCVGVDDQMVEARREGPKPLTSTIRFSK
jgi:hypothetical protein